MSTRKLISVVTPCFNEEGNVEELHQRIFEPYFTTKTDMGGTGIGLYMCSMIMKQSFGGDIRVENIMNETMCVGARFVLTFPKRRDV